MDVQFNARKGAKVLGKVYAKDMSRAQRKIQALLEKAWENVVKHST